MTERVCAWCGSSLEGRSQKAKYCTKACGSKANKKPWVPRPPLMRCCVICGASFAVSRSAKTCSRRCSEMRLKQQSIQWSKDNPDLCAERRRNWRSKNIDKERFLKRQRYAEDPERYREYCKSWRVKNIDDQRARERSAKRSIAAERALSILLLPSTQPPET